MKRSRRETFETHRPVEFVLDVGGPACELLALLLADKPVHAIVAKPGFPAKAQEYAGYREERILKLLIEIATSYRLVSWRLSPEQRAKEQNVQVGLWGIGDDDWDMSLSMHEACNKIIHADEFMFETRKVRRAALTYIRDDTILATGTKGRQHWTIALWIVEFSKRQ